MAALREREAGRDVACAIHPNLTACGDPALLRQVLENLLGNAWKFLRHTAGARIEFGTAGGDAQRLLFFVRDNGPGFDMAHAAPLFKPFHRLHTQQEFPGTGLGLATVAHRPAARRPGLGAGAGAGAAGRRRHLLFRTSPLKHQRKRHPKVPFAVELMVGDTWIEHVTPAV